MPHRDGQPREQNPDILSERMSNTEWRIGEEAEGVRLDKYLADQARLGSRGRAVAALERGKVYVNDAEAAPADAGRRLAQGDVVRLWVDRPGSAKRRPQIGRAHV